VVTIGGDILINRRGRGWTAAAVGVTSVSLFVVGWAWDHQYAPLVFATAPIVAVAGLIFTVVSIRRPRDVRSAVPALVGGGLSLLVLLGYAYALLAYAGGGN
jgi:peptidoglycan/LPS O-acetylase OafA/YrhL